MLALNRSNLVQSTMVSLATLASVGLFALVLAYWTWVWLAPEPETRAPAAAEPVVRAASATGLFGNAQRNASTPTGTAIKLHGVVAGIGNRRGYAVVQLDGRQILAVLEGEQIAPGIRLEKVSPDHIVMERGGIRETLAWPQKGAPVAAPAIQQGNK